MQDSSIKILCCCLFNVFLGCQNNQVDLKIQDTFTERKLAGDSYSIALPISYTLTESVGPNFFVYSFNPKDTSQNSHFSGALYFGYHPAGYSNEGLCINKTIKSRVLNSEINWEATDCDGKKSIHYIFVEPESYYRIHIFGEAKNQKQLDSLIMIFSTLQKR